MHEMTILKKHGHEPNKTLVDDMIVLRFKVRQASPAFLLFANLMSSMSLTS